MRSLFFPAIIKGGHEIDGLRLRMVHDLDEYGSAPVQVTMLHHSTVGFPVWNGLVEPKWGVFKNQPEPVIIMVDVCGCLLWSRSANPRYDLWR